MPHRTRARFALVTTWLVMMWLGAGPGLGLAPARAELLLNEIYYSPEEPKEGRQFIELRSTTDGVESLANLWILEIDGDPANVAGLSDNPGVVLSAIELTGHATGANGLFLWRDAAVELDNSPVPGLQGPGATAVLVRDLFPDRTDLGYEGNAGGAPDILSNDALNFLLVEGFTGAVGADLDTNGGPPGGDGALDVTPWTRVLDAISVHETTDNGISYAAGLGGVNVLTHFGPDLLYRDPVRNMWAMFDSGSGDSDPGYAGPFFANDGNWIYPGAGPSDAAFADGVNIRVASDSRFLYATPGAENATGVGGLYRGDTNHDGLLNAADIDTLFDHLNVVGTSYDVALNFGRSNQSDVSALIQTVLQTKAGDADLDRDVDGNDFALWQRGLGTDAGWAGGDFNGSGLVDAADLLIWKANFGFAATGAAAAPVPEPHTIAYLLAVLAVGCVKRTNPEASS